VAARSILGVFATGTTVIIIPFIVTIASPFTAVAEPVKYTISADTAPTATTVTIGAILDTVAMALTGLPDIVHIARTGLINRVVGIAIADTRGFDRQGV
jgi:hypothetical protein